MPGSQPTVTWKRQLEQVVPTLTGDRTLRMYLEGLQQFRSADVAALGEFKESLEYLKSLDTEALDILTRGVLDTASHRLDAWITSFATERLHAMRAQQPGGVYVGGYAWVENLKPAPAVATITPPAGVSAPVYAQSNDPGFIHAPSLTHAATAALLRNAHLGHTDTGAADGPFAIDLLPAECAKPNGYWMA